MKRLQVLVGCLLLALSLAGAAQAEEVKVLALFSNKALLQVGDQQKIVSSGETFKGVLLKSASGRGAVVEIDGETMKLGINQRIAGNFKKRKLSKFRIVPDSHGMYFVEGKINNQRTHFLVDTGATNVTLSGVKARALNIDFRKGAPGHAQTAAAVVPVWQIRLASVSIGTIRVTNVVATVIEGNHPAEVLLGNSFLSRTELTRSADRVLEITQRH